MTCAEARSIILSADHNALRDRTDPVLRHHLDGCAACASAASHVAADVARLRTALIARGSRAVPRPRRSKARRVAMTMIPIALAAELAAFAFLGNRDTANPLTDHVVIDDTVTTMLPVIHTRIDTGEVTRTAEPVKSSRAVSAARTAEDSARKDSTARAKAAEQSEVQVIPSDHAEHVAIIPTSNPKVTLVWITKPDSL